jgi:uncharacterized membrane protein YoaK (UPF0700 family)
MTPDGSRSERLGLADLGLALTALAAGSTDATAFLKLGMVFTSAMTGNTVLLCRRYTARNDAWRQALNLRHYPELAPWRHVPCGRAI